MRLLYHHLAILARPHIMKHCHFEKQLTRSSIRYMNSFSFPLPINVLLPLSQLTCKPSKGVSILLMRCNLVVCLLLFLGIVFNLLLHWDILPVNCWSHRLSFCCDIFGALFVSNGITGAARVLCAVHSGKMDVSEREGERETVARDIRHICVPLRNVPATVLKDGGV